ncbi:unnamed protein product [Rotaria magnacalcarata]|uniref:Autophagy-related protein 27 n=1 Tax=Rotaria magnacalcarata TaxID=392030 RepID=A0A819YI37_9BILA|nr:unnamed protein product [Rotaria magnacalcarata]CAF2179891.1 unnamed protein product [Rotaria magnacalcarata]CAF3783600.1 unnamed protein product [Rotaria magnacalcarata]CAF4158614.1 unnamed protein product [Rotaria magnacalcarata]
MIVVSIYIFIIFNIHIVKTNDCQYSTPDGIFDLRTLGYKNQPKYKNVTSSGSRFLKFSFNGCFPYSTTDTCKNAAACVFDEITSTDMLIARQANRKFTYTHGLITIAYTDGANSKVNVFLVCKDMESVQAAQVDDNTYLFNIESKCACPGKCEYTPDKSSGGLTGGAVFIIILVSLMATYAIVSVIFLRFVKHEQGINLVPNRSLWLQLGHDSIHGVRFLVAKIQQRNTYEKV